MKLIFTKNSEDIEINIDNDRDIFPFNYLDWINLLYDGIDIEETEFNGEISEIEIEKIKAMIDEISQIVTNNSEEN